MNKSRISPQKVILIISGLFFTAFLLFPMISILIKSVYNEEGLTLQHYITLFYSGGILRAFGNSTIISAASGVITTIFAFIPAYAVNYTNINGRIKKIILYFVMLPMLLPTITYGFAIIYSFGKQGFITKLFGAQIIDIYGVGGLILGYVIYTLPISFMLINNTMSYIDKKFMTISRLMGDKPLKTFWTTVITPLIGTFAVSFIQSFTLSFTDYGIPTALAGNIDLLATRLYSEMLGSLPNFNTGSAVSIIMLLPSVASIVLISVLNRYNIRYTKISKIELQKNRLRDAAFGALSAMIITGILSVFTIIFIMPFIEQYPYRINFTFSHIAKIFSDSSLMSVYGNSLFTAFLTSVFGTLIVYACALVSARKGTHRHYGKIPDTVSLITNTIPGMVLGVAYLLTLRNTPLLNTFPILIICNIVHYFSSPYLMMKSSLEKLNSSWETTARLMGDSWLKTVLRIITPNAARTLLEVFSYFFVNAMVTVSAVIFLASTKTMIITAKIKELQHFANFNEIFVLSILILITNLAVKGFVRLLAGIKMGKTRKERKQ